MFSVFVQVLETNRPKASIAQEQSFLDIEVPMQQNRGNDMTPTITSLSAVKQEEAKVKWRAKVEAGHRLIKIKGLVSSGSRSAASRQYTNAKVSRTSF